MFQTIAEQLRSEWQVISQAPMDFFAAVLVVGIGIWLFVRHQYSERFTTVANGLEVQTKMKEAYCEQLKAEQTKNELLLCQINEGEPTKEATERQTPRLNEPSVVAIRGTGKIDGNVVTVGRVIGNIKALDVDTSGELTNNKFTFEKIQHENRQSSGKQQK